MFSDVKILKKNMYNLINAVVCCVLVKTIHNKETKREAENERRENERSQSRDKKAITANFVPNLKC